MKRERERERFALVYRPVRWLITQSYILTYYRLRKREHLVELGSHYCGLQCLHPRPTAEPEKERERERDSRVKLTNLTTFRGPDLAFVVRGTPKAITN